MPSAGDLVSYVFVGLVVGVFIFVLIDTVSTAQKKIAKKRD